ncbi:hypothetical protein [Synechocystis sp. LKSZ1]|uniref:hypothetical protein n=1 Tax=Synechocystis sp. LKSZ1 TaxID=3144951 RepID=UPI00336BB8CE
MNSVIRPFSSSLNWPAWVMGCLGFWLSASLVLDLIVMPSLFAAGMMGQGSFVEAGYFIFGLFNRVELLCAAVILSGLFWLRHSQAGDASIKPLTLILAGLLLLIALSYTYGLTPALSGLGFEMTRFNAEAGLPATMMPLHGLYWSLESLKLLAGVLLLAQCWSSVLRHQTSVSS